MIAKGITREAIAQKGNPMQEAKEFYAKEFAKMTGAELMEMARRISKAKYKLLEEWKASGENQVGGKFKVYLWCCGEMMALLNEQEKRLGVPESADRDRVEQLSM